MTTETVPDPTYSRHWLILTVVGVAQVMVLLDATVVNIALPCCEWPSVSPHWRPRISPLVAARAAEGAPNEGAMIVGQR